MVNQSYFLLVVTIHSFTTLFQYGKIRFNRVVLPLIRIGYIKHSKRITENNNYTEYNLQVGIHDKKHKRQAKIHLVHTN